MGRKVQASYAKLLQALTDAENREATAQERERQTTAQRDSALALAENAHQRQGTLAAQLQAMRRKSLEQSLALLQAADAVIIPPSRGGRISHAHGRDEKLG